MCSRKEQISDIANGLRRQMSRLKTAMDVKGIFHPEANAERAFSQFLVKYYRK